MEDELFFDPLKCVDCRICELACSFANQGGFNPRYSQIKILIHPETGVNTVSLSNGCTLCHVCEAHCPTGALRFSSEFHKPLENSRGGTVVRKGFSF